MPVAHDLNHLGSRGIPLAWLASYLTDRQQYLMINDQIFSKHQGCMWGSPGLGPQSSPIPHSYLTSSSVFSSSIQL